MQKEEGPKKIKDVVSDILSSLTGEKTLGAGQKKILFEEEIRKIWTDSVGEKAASHSKPTSLRNGRVVVLVDNSAWLYELTLKKEKIIRDLKQYLGEEKIQEIRFKIGEI